MITENKQSKINLEQERKIANLQERVDKLKKTLLCGKGNSEP